MPIPVHVAMAAYPLAIWGFTVASVLSDPAFTNLPRNLDAVELWSGVHSIGPPCRECGLRALPFDKCRQGVSGDSEDILTRNGFLNALQLVMRLVVGGLLWQAPVCASMGFPNSSNCKRSTANPLGATTYAPVKEGNAMAEVACLMLALAAVRGVKAAIENPPGSWIWKLPFVERALSVLQVSWSVATRCAYDDAAPGKRFNKPYKFAAIGDIEMRSPEGGIMVGHGDWILAIAGKCVCPWLQLRRFGKKRKLRDHVPLMRRNQRGRSCGDLARLRLSAGYPPRMVGEALL